MIPAREPIIYITTINGKTIADKTVFPINSKILYNASSSNLKRLYYFENAGHSKSVESDRESYKQKIEEFIKSVGEQNGNWKETFKTKC